jgi:hypothetical protein
MKDLIEKKREIAEGAAFSGLLRSAMNGMTTARSSLEQMNGLFDYRLRGAGRTTSNISSDSVLTPKETKKAKKAWSDLMDMIRSLEKAQGELRGFKRTAMELDRFMEYS